LSVPMGDLGRQEIIVDNHTAPACVACMKMRRPSDAASC
jgi:hypothetical protein